MPNVTVTMLETRLGEDGQVWVAGGSYNASENFARVLITSNLATGTLPEPDKGINVLGWPAGSTGGGGGSGDVLGPSSATDGAVALYDGTTGKLLKNGAVPGTAYTRNVPATGDAASSQVVLGSDTRLTDARTPTSHTHPASAISDSTTAGRALLTAADASAQRTSLGLGGAATLNVGTTTGTVAAGDDSRLTDARTPTAHKTSHATGGSDALTPADIGAAAAGAATGSGLTIANNKILGRTSSGSGALEEISIGSGLSMTSGTLSATGAGGSGDVVGPSSATNGAVALYDGTTGKLLKNGAVPGTAYTKNVPVTGDAASGEVVLGNDTRLTDARTPTSHTHPASAISDSTTAGRALLTAADASAQRTSLGLGGAAVLNVGTTTGTVAAGDDARFAATTWSTAGFSGQITPDNFGVQYIGPIRWEDVSGSAAGLQVDSVNLFTGAESAGWTRVFLTFHSSGASNGLFATGSTTINTTRLQDFRNLIKFWRACGKRVLVNVHNDVPYDTTTMQLFRDRMELFWRIIGYDSATVGTAMLEHSYPDAIEPINEPYNYYVNNAAQFGNSTATFFARLAEVQRITHTITKAVRPECIVCTSCFQGGETALVESLLAASAAGVTCRGSTGTGTRGEQYLDVIAYHPYPSYTLLSEINAALTSSAMERLIASYSTWIQTAVANRRAAGDGGSAYWAGKPDPEYWVTEINASWFGGQITANTQFRYQAYSDADRTAILQCVIAGCFAAGYNKVFLYAGDHGGSGGPWVPNTDATLTSNALGELRLTSSAVKLFDGDVVSLDGGNLPYPVQGKVYNASADGSSFDLVNIPSSYSPSWCMFQRQLLGGWVRCYEKAVSLFYGESRVGLVAVGGGDTPVVQVEHGPVKYRKVAGKYVRQ